MSGWRFPSHECINFVDTLTCQATKSRVIKWRRCRGRCYFTVNISVKWRRCRGKCYFTVNRSVGEMEIPHEDQSSHYDHEKYKFAYLSMRDRIELGKRQVQQSQWGSKYALNGDDSYEHTVGECPTIPTVRDMCSYQSSYTSSWNKHPNLTTQPQPQPSMSTSSLEQAILKISKVMEDFVSEQQKINSHLNEKIDNLESSINVQDDKGLPEPFKASTSPGKRRETNSLGPNGKDANFVWDPGGIQHEVGTMLAKIEMEVKQRKQGSQNAKAKLSVEFRTMNTLSANFSHSDSAWCEKEFLYILESQASRDAIFAPQLPVRKLSHLVYLGAK
uniref:Uncharacterized protein n=1 Tax=Vitis vinifera TaxID=29760 RepID=A5C124_VITVI|nr:hypothetical protein VITISV_005747 [Vitis vinifera]